MKVIDKNYRRREYTTLTWKRENKTVNVKENKTVNVYMYSELFKET